jgi:nucleoid-associated protein YgaU
VTREHKLALIVGFALILVVGVFVSDHFSKARLAKPDDRLATSAGMPARQQNQPVAFPAAPTPIVQPVAAVPEPPAHRPGEIDMGRRPQLGSGLAGAMGGADRGVGSLPGAGGSTLAPAPLTPAAKVVTVPGEGVIPIGSVEPAPPQTAPASLPVSSGELRRHTVGKGDSLAKIANRYYGDEKLWRKLAEYNGPRVGANSSVNQGVTLLIPPRDVLMGDATLAPEGARPAPAPTPAPTKRTDVAKADPKKPEPTRGDTRKTDAGKPVVKPEPGKAGAKAEAGKPGAQPEAGKPGSSPEAPKAPERTYTVKAGDTLALIAERELGSGKRWREIKRLNAGVLGEDDTITVGMVLKLPAKG